MSPQADHGKVSISCLQSSLSSFTRLVLRLFLARPVVPAKFPVYLALHDSAHKLLSLGSRDWLVWPGGGRGRARLCVGQHTAGDANDACLVFDCTSPPFFGGWAWRWSPTPRSSVGGIVVQGRSRGIKGVSVTSDSTLVGVPSIPDVRLGTAEGWVGEKSRTMSPSLVLSLVDTFTPSRPITLPSICPSSSSILDDSARPQTDSTNA